MSLSVGFIGLGNIGKPMAVNAVQAGFPVTVFDLNEEPCRELAALGAKVARSARELAESSDLISIIVVNDQQVKEVMTGENGVLEGAKRGAIAAIHSTVRVDTMHNMAKAAAEHGVTVIDAMVTGGARGIKAKTMCYMVGGESAAFERALPVFRTSSASGERIIHMGGVGTGAAAKIAHNMMVHINMLSAAEGIRLAHKAGIDMDAFKRVLEGGSAQSRVAYQWGRRHQHWDVNAPGEVSPTPRHAYKDIGLALELGHELGLALPGAALAQQLRDSIG